MDGSPGVVWGVSADLMLTRGLQSSCLSALFLKGVVFQNKPHFRSPSMKRTKEEEWCLQSNARTHYSSFLKPRSAAGMLSTIGKE